MGKAGIFWWFQKSCYWTFSSTSVGRNVFTQHFENNIQPCTFFFCLLQSSIISLHTPRVISVAGQKNSIRSLDSSVLESFLSCSVYSASTWEPHSQVDCILATLFAVLTDRLYCEMAFLRLFYRPPYKSYARVCWLSYSWPPSRPLNTQCDHLASRCNTFHHHTDPHTPPNPMEIKHNASKFQDGKTPNVPAVDPYLGHISPIPHANPHLPLHKTPAEQYLIIFMEHKESF